MEGGGVMGMLEVCESDFARLESETTAAEAENAKSYDEFMADSTATKDAKTAEMKDKESEKQAKESAKAQAEKDLKGVSEELTAALAYYEKLKPSCMMLVRVTKSALRAGRKRSSLSRKLSRSS